jgi:hypothetical protein
MRTRLGQTWSFVLVLLAGTLSLSAHHGNASYDISKTVTISGTVTEFVWTNPHVFLRVNVKDENGEIAHWVFEAQNVVNQATAGWSKAMFKPGDQVTIDAVPAKNGRRIGRFRGRIVINGVVFDPQR